MQIDSKLNILILKHLYKTYDNSMITYNYFYFHKVSKSHYEYFLKKQISLYLSVKVKDGRQTINEVAYLNNFPQFIILYIHLIKLLFFYYYNTISYSYSNL